MAAEEVTPPKDETPTMPAAKDWDAIRARLEGASVAEGEPTPEVSKSEAAEKKIRTLSRRARIAIPALLFTAAVALIWIVVPGLVGGGSMRQSQPASGALPANARKARRRSSPTRWVKESDAGTQPQRGRTVPGVSRAGRRTHPRNEPPRSVPAAPKTPSQPPASGTAPSEPPAEPSEPAPPPTAEPAEKPGLRDGATESAEFGL
jgi:hypothetical protein